ncbi:MAG: hypothetical protein ACI4OD_08175, partial [Selenomonas sp.]
MKYSSSIYRQNCFITMSLLLSFNAKAKIPASVRKKVPVSEKIVCQEDMKKARLRELQSNRQLPILPARHQASTFG